MSRSRARSNPPADLLLLFRPIGSPDTAVRLARAAGRLLMLAGVVVVVLGFLADHAQTMVEGTLVTLLALAAGWARSRFAATLLTLLVALGLFGGLAAGAAPETLLFLVAVLGVCLRLAESTFRFRTVPEGKKSLR